MTLPEQPVTPMLGCAENYRAKVFRWDRTNNPVPGLRFVTDLPRLSQVSWERVESDMSDASVTFAPTGDQDCCGNLAPRWNPQGELIQTGVWPYAHELALYRDGERDPLWMGPIVPLSEEVQPDGTTEQITIKARDILHYTDVRLTHEDMWYQDAAPEAPIAWGRADSGNVARWLVDRATDLDDPGLRDSVHITPTGVLIQRTGRAREFYIGEELRDLARSGLVFYTVGRAAYMHGDWQPNVGQNLKRLTHKDFLGSNTILVDAVHAATAVSVVGAVPAGTTDTTNTEPVKTYAGGVDPFFGLIERLQRAENITDQTTLDEIARRVVGYGNPPPTILTVDNGAVLSPDAPVSIHDLVPTRWFQLEARGTCRTVQRPMKLSHVKVDWAAGTGGAGGTERVQVAFAPPSVTGAAT